MGNEEAGPDPGDTSQEKPAAEVFTDEQRAEIIKLADLEIDKNKKAQKQPEENVEQGLFSEEEKALIKNVVDQEIIEQNKKLKITATEKFSTKKWTLLLAILIMSIVVAGVFLSISYTYFAAVPFSVVLAGIVAFFGIMIISNQLADRDEINSGEMRRAIAVAIVVVYLGLLPTLAFQGILQYQVLGLNETATSNVTFNGSTNVTTNETIPAAPLPVELSQTAISSFTALVTAVILSYFGLRTWKEVEEIKNQSNEDEKK